MTILIYRRKIGLQRQREIQRRINITTEAKLYMKMMWQLIKKCHGWEEKLGRGQEGVPCGALRAHTWWYHKSAPRTERVHLCWLMPDSLGALLQQPRKVTQGSAATFSMIPLHTLLWVSRQNKAVLTVTMNWKATPWPVYSFHAHLRNKRLRLCGFATTNTIKYEGSKS